MGAEGLFRGGAVAAPHVSDGARAPRYRRGVVRGRGVAGVTAGRGEHHGGQRPREGSGGPVGREPRGLPGLGGERDLGEGRGPVRSPAAGSRRPPGQARGSGPVLSAGSRSDAGPGEQVGFRGRPGPRPPARADPRRRSCCGWVGRRAGTSEPRCVGLCEGSGGGWYLAKLMSASPKPRRRSSLPNTAWVAALELGHGSCLAGG